MWRQNSPCLRFLYSSVLSATGGLMWWVIVSLMAVSSLCCACIFRVEVGVNFGVVAQRLQRGVGVALRVAVADDHGYVFADAFGAECGGRERRRHREEVDGAVLLGGKDRSELRPRNVDAVDRDVGQLRRGGRNLLRNIERVPGVRDDECVDQSRA